MATNQKYATSGAHRHYPNIVGRIFRCLRQQRKQFAREEECTKVAVKDIINVVMGMARSIRHT